MSRIAAERRVVIVAATVVAVLAALGAGLLKSGGDGPELRGVVVDPSGAPIAGAEVGAGNKNATTDPSGRFRIRGSARWVTVRAKGWLPRTRTAAPGTPVVIRLAADAPGTVTFAFGGDVMFGRRFFDANEDGRAGGLLRTDAGVAEHLGLLEGVRPALSDADLTVVNLESPLAENPYPDPTKRRPASFHPTKDFVFASRPAAARALARAGIDVVGIANNHLFDRLGPGVASTRAGLEAAGFGRGRGFFGAGTREDDAWAPAIREVDGQRVGFVGCTSISGDDQKVTYVAGPRKGGAARCEEGRLRRDVAALASRTDIVVAMIHGGFEYGRDPSGQIRALSDAAVAAGATMVINHHPHVVGGLRFANGRLTAWTLGNLLFDQTVWPTFESYLLRVAARQGKVVSAWIEPLRIQHFQPTGVFGEDGAWVARGALARSAGPWIVDDGSLWLDAARKSRVARRPAGRGLEEIRAGCSESAGRDLLWTGDFEARDLDDTPGAPLWNVDNRTRDRRVVAGAAFGGRAGVRLRRSGANLKDIVLNPEHRILVRPSDELTVLLRHRTVSGRADAKLVLSWYNDTRGGSQEQTVVQLPRDSDWRSERLDVTVPANAVAVQPYVRLAPPDLSLDQIDIDNVRLIDWDEPGCGYVRAGAVVEHRALAPTRPDPVVQTVKAEPLLAPQPAPLPPGPEDPDEFLPPRPGELGE